jgi:hypothetical protein
MDTSFSQYLEMAMLSRCMYRDSDSIEKNSSSTDCNYNFFLFANHMLLKEFRIYCDNKEFQFLPFC